MDPPYVFLLFVHVADLEPNIFLAQRPWRIGYDVTEALLWMVSEVTRATCKAKTHLETLRELLLLLVYYTEPEVDLIGFLEARLHPHDL